MLALVARVVPVWRGGGLSATNGYDDGVYYAAATSLVHGQLPYRDYVLLHPPGSTVLLAPFALLARVTSDTAGFEAARVAFMVLGAVNTLLVMVVPPGSDAGPRSSPGVFYALFFPAVFVARTVSLEELGTTTLLVALALLFRGDGAWRPTNTQVVLAGVALGVGAAVKIWGVDPFVVVLVWQAIVAGRAAAARLVAGAVAAAVVLCLPFFAAAPSTMFRYVVRDQIGRPAVRRQRLVAAARHHGSAPAARVAGPPWPAYVFLVVVVLAGLVRDGGHVAAGRRPGSSGRWCWRSAWSCSRRRRSSITTPRSPRPRSRWSSAASAEQVPIRAGRPAAPSPPMVAAVPALVLALAAPGVLRPQGIHVPRALADRGGHRCRAASPPTIRPCWS